MTAVLIGAGCFMASVWLWHSSKNFTIDASPVGSMMLVASIGLFAAALFTFGIVVGQLT